MRLIDLPAHQPPDRFYAGGPAIRDFRGAGAAGGRVPEDWIASTTCLFGEQSLGLTRLPDGRVLREAVEADPEYWLGADHVRSYGSDTRLLTKLIDAGQRLPVHVHPDDAFAAEHLGHRHGKTEAWYALRPGAVHLGFTRDVGSAELEHLVATQDAATLLALTHRVHLEPGDTVLVPSGFPHAIGEGLLVVEVQQPEDLSILLEWVGFDIDGTVDGHLGLGFAHALEAVRRTQVAPDELSSLVLRSGTSGLSRLPELADPFFRLEELDADSPRPVTGLAVVIVVDGSGALLVEDGEALPIAAGSTVLVPFAAGSVRLSGRARAVVCRPPLP